MFAGCWLACGGAQCVFGGLGARPQWCVFHVLVLVVEWGVRLGCGWCSFEFAHPIFGHLVLLLKKFFFSFLLWWGGGPLSISLSIILNTNSIVDLCNFNVHCLMYVNFEFSCI